MMLLTGMTLSAQEQLSHEKNYHVGEDGKLFWQANQPVYLFVSQSQDGSNSTRLGDTTAQNNPIYLDTEGVNWIRTRWAYDPVTKKKITPEQEVMFPVYRDGTAPEVSVDFKGAPTYISGPTTYYGKNLEVGATSKDWLSGLEEIYLSKNAGSFESYNNASEVSEDGQYTYKYYAVDKVGNVGEVDEYKFTVDVTAPVTSYLVENDFMQQIFSARTKVKFEGVDSSSGLKRTYYSVDGGQRALYNGFVSMYGVEDGSHSLSYYSEDNVGNFEEEKKIDFYLDKTLPEVESIIEGDQFDNGKVVYVSSRTNVKLTSEDNRAGVESISYLIDNKNETTYEGPFALPDVNGRHSVTYYATDKVGNNHMTLNDPSGVSKKYYQLDNVSPSLSNSFDGSQYFTRDTMFITNETKINLKAVDYGAGVKEIQYRINGGEYLTYDEAFTIADEGTYKIEYTGIDNVNNSDSKSFCFRVDKNGPIVERILSMEPVGTINLDEYPESLEVHTKGVKLYLGATDEIIDTDVVFYSINDQPEQRYVKPVTLNSVGVVSYKVRALDKLGNETLSAKAEIFVK